MELDSTQLQLIQKSFVSALSEEERTALNDCLRNSEAARSYYRRAAKLDTLLKETSLTVLENSTTSNMTPFIMWKIAALFFMTLSLILFLQLKLSFDNSNSLETTSYVPKSLALIRHAVNLNTQDSLALENTKTLSSGIVSIAQGLVQLDFISGVTIIAEGPFKLDLISDMQITCTQGKIRVLIPPQAKAFKLATPDLDFLTSGSEFGVSVTKEGSAIDIIDGLLEIQHHHATLTTLKKDDQVLITNGLLTASHAPFSTPSPQDLSLALEQSIQNHQQKWLDSLLTILQDQELSLYYDFHKNDAWGKTLRNLIASPQSLTYGAIIGAQWAQGRMGQDTALEFKGNDHFVRLEDQTHYQSITLLTWIWIDTLDASFTTLLSSDYWKEKGVHWHISNKGVLTLGVYPPKGKNAIFRSPEGLVNPSHFGKWIMISAVYDGPNGLGKQYINDELVDVHTNLDSCEGYIGKAQIGNWFNGSQANRGLNGKMDRFIVWSKALSDSEIKQQYLNSHIPSQLALSP